MGEFFKVEVEWDATKAEVNLRKHGVSFGSAATILRDPLAVATPDEAYGDTEERWITIGRTPTGECLLVVHTWVELEANSAKARIISARKAENSERKQYEEGL